MITKGFQILFLFFVLMGSANSQAPAIQWQYCYGNLGHDEIFGAQQTTDGGYILCGLTGISLSDENCWIVKLDPLGTVIWQKTIGGLGKERAVSIKQTADGGYIVGGYTDSNDGDFSTNHGGKDYLVVKLNNVGDIVWQKLFGGNGDQILHSIQQTTDAGFIVCGYTNGGGGDVSFPIGGEDFWIVKLDALGNIIWQRCYGSGGNDRGYGAKQTSDGGYIAVGYIGNNTGISNSKAGIIKITSTGDVEWQKTYGTIEGGDLAVDVCLLSDGSYGIGAVSQSYNDGDVTDAHGNVDYWVLKLNLAGNILWQRSLGGCCSDNMTCINATPDGGMIGVGIVFSANTGNITGTHGSGDYWVVKLSSAGDLLWQKALGGNSVDWGYYVSQTADLGYIVAGYTDSNNSGDVGNSPNPINFHAGWVVKLMPDAVPVVLVAFDAKTLGKVVLCTWKTLQEQNSSNFIIERSDDGLHFNSVGRLAAAGNSQLPIDYQFTDRNVNPNAFDYVYYRLKMVDLDGSFKYSNIVKVKLNYGSGLSINPNPVRDQLHIFYASSIAREGILTIVDHVGQTVYRQPIKILKGNNSFQVDTHQLPTGSYNTILNAEKKYVARFFKLNNN